MSETATTDAPIWLGPWWEMPEYTEGEIILPGQSCLIGEDREVLEDIGRKVDEGKIEIPAMPKAAMEAAKLLRNPEPEIEEVARCIELDPAMAAWLLRHANSALYGARFPIDSVSRAVAHLGLRRLKGVILELAMKRLSDYVGSRPWAEREWTYAIYCATIARELGKIFNLDEDMCYLAGLLHDVGRLLALRELEVRGRLKEGPSSTAADDIIMECLHRCIGSRMAKKWDLPPAIADAISFHLSAKLPGEQSPAKFPSTLATEAASDLCLALGLGRDRMPCDALHLPSMLELGFTPESLKQFYKDRLADVIEQAKSCFVG